MYASRKALTIYEEVKKGIPWKSHYCGFTSFVSRFALLRTYWVQILPCYCAHFRLLRPYFQSFEDSHTVRTLFLTKVKFFVHGRKKLRKNHQYRRKLKLTDVHYKAKSKKLQFSPSGLVFICSNPRWISSKTKLIKLPIMEKPSPILWIQFWRDIWLFFCFESIDDHFMNTIKFEFPEYYTDIALTVDLNREPEMKFYTFHVNSCIFIACSKKHLKNSIKPVNR